MSSRSQKQELLDIVRHRSRANQAYWQTEIHNQMLRNSDSIRTPNFSKISSADLGVLFQLTDECFFDGSVGRLCESVAKRPLSFRLSTRMTTSGGMTTMHSIGSKRSPKQIEFEIAIATTPLFHTFKESTGAKVGGMNCRSRLEALQRIMEHEMVHLIELLLWHDSNCAASQFKRIAKRFFRHTESNHQLLTPTDLARKRLGIQPGDRVRFAVEGREFTGYVNRITKRATVLVEDPDGIQYSDGRKYHKFYVPLQRLKRA